jgi:hypothetical protein
MLKPMGKLGGPNGGATHFLVLATTSNLGEAIRDLFYVFSFTYTFLLKSDVYHVQVVSQLLC